MPLKNQVNLQSPFERLKSHNTDPYVALSKAVILQAVVDLTSVAQKNKDLRYKLDSMQWIFLPNTSFGETCTSAGFEKEYVRKIAQDFLSGIIDEEGAYSLILETRARKAMNSATAHNTTISKTKLTKTRCVKTRCSKKNLTFNQYQQSFAQADFKQACI